MESYFGDFRLGNLIFQRSLAIIYLIAFVAALSQFRALLGRNGLLPVPAFLRDVPFANAPTIYHFFYSDRFFLFTAWVGIVVSALFLSGLIEKGPWYVPTAPWLTLYVLYLSIVNAGQTFYAFGWESMLLEAAFFAAFLGPAAMLCATDLTSGRRIESRFL